ncbi:hypothetical protein [Methylobacterium isbiliense]|jgi:hypothetical protein|uniref:Cobalt-zinc-cadmium resistance protein CzcI n=1 Tax=Methylobacterium isbiliense TaxID=315478 RepID=A0ABQ4S8V4_9HYPH|nr:hypothetical protein [Methylobacterium isbiliense]MDN3623224.1 hypothetical protein [Methylobacterium isbiliense]GJD98294.1 hypothetical protein GMJLKIPL_0201 [Methylobacterium isbiliense]
MTLPRFLARLLAALFVTIAGCLLASAAQAHAGHVHEPARVAEAGARAHPDLALDRRPDAPEPRLASADRGPACHGVCCSLGASCCAPSLGPPALPGLGALGAGSRLAAAAQPFRAGLPPEAPPRPPRTRA